VDQLSAMKAFVQIVESGNFAKASERLGISTSACSRQVADLEAHLGVRLLNRTTRKLSLTESGQAFFERSLQLLSDLEEAEQFAAQSARVPRGTLKLTCSTNFGMRQLAPAIADFMARHAAVKFDVSLSDRIVDLVEEGFDLAVRIGSLGSQNLVAKKLGESRMIACASPAYLKKHGTPRSPDDLARHNCFIYAYGPAPGQWLFRDGKGGERLVRISGNLHSNNGDMLAAAAAQGAGIVWEPAFIVGPDLRAGRLVSILDAFEAPPVDIWAVYPSRRHLSAKVRAFVDFLAERFRDAGDWGAA
jgi:DNA-binding transcriptional LysR family regulator